jgi:hypothetical protein
VRTRICAYAIVAAALQVNNALAHPDGAPWGAARPSAGESCATCHFDNEAIHESLLLSLDGLPQDPEPGETYDLKVSLHDPGAVVVGFQLIASADDDQAGEFDSTAADVESVGAAIRSTAPVKNDGTVSWQLEWRAPGRLNPTIVFHVAASAANHDESPLGDRIHFRSYTLSTKDP